MPGLFDIELNNGAIVPIMSGTSPTVGFDFTKWLMVGETVDSPTAALYDLQEHEYVPELLVDDPGISGNIVYQKIAELAAGKRYRIEIRFRRLPGPDTDGGYAIIGVPA